MGHGALQTAYERFVERIANGTRRAILPVAVLIVYSLSAGVMYK